MKIGVLGLGKMGRPIASLLLKAGHEVTVYNRSHGPVAALAAEGARTASTPAAAARHADVLVSVLGDDAAVERVVLGPSGDPDFSRAPWHAIDGLNAGAVHACLSTIGVDLSKRLAEEHHARGQHFVAAPVFGRPNVAAEGRLWIVAAGEEAAVAHCRPVFDAIGRGTTALGREPWRAHALKLGGNFLIAAMIESLSESLVYAAALGIDRATFLATVNEALFRSPFYEAYGTLLVRALNEGAAPQPPGATVHLGLKDTNLFRAAAAEAGLTLPLAEMIHDALGSAVAAGMGDDDWAAGQALLAERRARPGANASTPREGTARHA